MKKTPYSSLLTALLLLINPFLAVLAQTPTNHSSLSATTAINTDRIRQIAESITVKILVDDTNGSGIIIAKNGTTYTVITNAHVVIRDSSYRIQTPDSKIHQATLKHKGASIEGNDLAILEFQSASKYSIATIGESAKENDLVFSAGFPVEEEKLRLTNGKITLVSPKPLKGGYQIAYSNETQQGMSGGALLDAEGKLIGIIGMGKGAIFDEAYTYLDNTRPSSENIERWRKYSFAVPFESIEQFSTQLAQLLPNPRKQNAQYTGIVKKIDDIAEQITVRIDSPNDSNGSGVIIGKQGNTYYIATACHVVTIARSTCKTENLENNLTLITPDGKKHSLTATQTTIFNKDLDMAIVKFTSDKTYQVAELYEYPLEGKQQKLV